MDFSPFWAFMVRLTSENGVEPSFWEVIARLLFASIIVTLCVILMVIINKKVIVHFMSKKT